MHFGSSCHFTGLLKLSMAGQEKSIGRRDTVELRLMNIYDLRIGHDLLLSGS